MGNHTFAAVKSAEKKNDHLKAVLESVLAELNELKKLSFMEALSLEIVFGIKY